MNQDQARRMAEEVELPEPTFVQVPDLYLSQHWYSRSQVREAIAAALVVKLTEGQKPAAWRTFDGEGGYYYRSYEGNENYRDDFLKRNGPQYEGWVDLLYTTKDQAVMSGDVVAMLRAFERLKGCA